MLIWLGGGRFCGRLLQAERHLRPEENPSRCVAVVYAGVGVVWDCKAHGGTVRSPHLSPPLSGVNGVIGVRVVVD